MKRRKSQSRFPQNRELHLWELFALIFSAIFLLHGPLLRLPYFWDEAGYYVPAAYDLFSHGTLIPQSVPSNAHPPLPSIYLALWWKLSAFRPAVTRTAMLLLAAAAFTAIYRLSRLLSNLPVAWAVTVCTALYPVWFAQSSLAHADLPAATFTLWALFFYFQWLDPAGNRRFRNLSYAAILFALAALSKETAILVPLTLAAYELCVCVRRREFSGAPVASPLLLALSAVPLAAWFAYHRLRTGFFFGNPEFFAYNVSGTLTPLRFVLSLGIRLWQVLGYMSLWLLTIATVWAMSFPAVAEGDGTERQRIALPVQYRIAAILAVNVVAFAAVGGAVLARYLLPCYPLVILIGIATLRRRVPEWTWVTGIVGLGFVLALFTNPFGYIPPEDNLSYRDYVVLHKLAANYLSQHESHKRILTAWTATDELTKPFLGYVREPLRVVGIDNFSYGELEKARLAQGEYDAALVFSTKQEPGFSLLDRWSWWEQMSRRFFGFHRDLPPEVAAQILGGRVIWSRTMGRQWIAVIAFDRIENAALVVTPYLWGVAQRDLVGSISGLPRCGCRTPLSLPRVRLPSGRRRPMRTGFIEFMAKLRREHPKRALGKKTPRMRHPQ